MKFPELAIRPASPDDAYGIGQQLLLDGEPIPWPTVALERDTAAYRLDLDPEGLTVLHLAIPVRIVPWPAEEPQP